MPYRYIIAYNAASRQGVFSVYGKRELPQNRGSFKY